MIGAFAVGFAYGAITLYSGGNIATASYSSALIESSINEIARYMPWSRERNSLRGDGSESLKRISIETAINGILTMATGKLAEKARPIRETERKLIEYACQSSVQNFFLTPYTMQLRSFTFMTL